MMQVLRKIFEDRLYGLLFIVGFGFIILAFRLFTLQIVLGEENEKNFSASITRKLPIKSARGSIFDRNGTPLATNKVVFNLKFDSSKTIKNLNDELVELITVLENNEQEINDTMPISIEKPYKFLYESEDKEKRWKRENGLDEKLTAEQVMEEYIKKFDIKTEGISEKKIRQLIGLRFEINAMRYKKYNPINIALDVPNKVITIIEENNVKFPGIYVEAEPIRYYPDGEAFSHIIGYTGNINNEELEQLKSDKDGQNYSESSIVGKLGIEKEMEKKLRGIDGEVYVEVDNFGRILNTSNMTDTMAGNDVFLTIDARLQKKTQEILEKKLTDIIIGRINSSKPSEAISLSEIFDALAKNNVVDINAVLEGKKKYQTKIAKRVRDYANLNSLDNSQVFYQLYLDNKVSYLDIIMLLIEQGKIKTTDSETRNIEAGNISYLSFIIDRMRRGDITPHDLAFDPATGAVVVEDVKTGEILSLVNYPSYDNNKLANNFDYEYYKKLLSDKTTPLINRALSQRKAPGSTFKPITALAALEENAISTTGTIYDDGIFKDAGEPYAKCWTYGENGGGQTHGQVDVRKSLEVSCNFFYYTVSYRLGFLDGGGRSSIKGINLLNKYTKMFGLSEKSGIELPELEAVPQLSSPENKETSILRYNPKANSYQTKWYDGDTIRSAIGQGWSNFAPIHMAKYVATLASGGNRLRPYIIKSAQTPDGENILSKSTVLEEKLNFKPENLKAVFEGMLRVTSGSQGTSRSYFANFPIEVAGKTGTAQEGTKPPHAWFVSFAPYDDPQIAVVVMIPYGNSSGNAVSVGKDVIAEYYNLNKTNDAAIQEENVLVE